MQDIAITRPSNQRSLNFSQDQSVDLVFEDESPSDDSVTDVDVYVASGLEVEEERVEVMETDKVRFCGFWSWVLLPSGKLT